MGRMAYTILVADDEPAIRTMLEVILSADGHDIVAVSDGKSARDYLREHTPDAMLLDVTTILRDHGLLSEHAFAALVTLAVLSTLLTGPFFRALVRRRPQADIDGRQTA